MSTIFYIYINIKNPRINGDYTALDMESRDLETKIQDP